MDNNSLRVVQKLLSDLVTEAKKQTALKAIEVKLLSGKYAMNISAHSAICNGVDAIVGVGNDNS